MNRLNNRRISPLRRRLVWVLLGVPLAHAAEARDLQYTCAMTQRPPIALNLSKRSYRMAGQYGQLNEGLFFNFTTRLGYRVVMDLGDPDSLRSRAPSRFEGSVTIEKSGRRSPPMKIDCRRAGA